MDSKDALIVFEGRNIRCTWNNNEWWFVLEDEYKKVKGLKQQNLRDHMNDLELIFTMLGEASTTKIARNKDAIGFDENKDAAKEGGTVAGIAREELEKRSGEKVVSNENYLEVPENTKRIENKKK